MKKSDIPEIKNDAGQTDIPDDRNYFCPPLLNDSIYRATNKVKETKGILEGDKILSIIQDLLVTPPFLSGNSCYLGGGYADGGGHWSTAALGSFNGFSLWRRKFFPSTVSGGCLSMTAGICKVSEQSEDPEPSNLLFGDDLSSKIKKISQENK